MIELLFQFLIIIIVIVLFPLFIYISRCIRFYRYQRYLIYTPHFNIEIKSREKTIAHEEIYYQTADGTLISAWYVPYSPNIPPVPDDDDVHDHMYEEAEVIEAPAAEERTSPQDSPQEINTEPPGKPGGVILFCHGNAGNISQRIDSFKIFRELRFSTFIFDYRGYGKSIGIPGEKGTYLDADGAWDYLVNKMNIKPEEIIIFGRSLGGAIAAYLAQKYQPRALIIESSFTSALDMATMFFRRLPVKLLTRYKYNTVERLKDIHCPVLIVHSPDDRVIPFRHGQILFETANPPKKFLRIKGGHLDGFLSSRTLYVDALREFLAELPEPFLTAAATEVTPKSTACS